MPKQKNEHANIVPAIISGFVLCMLPVSLEAAVVLIVTVAACAVESAKIIVDGEIDTVGA
jgi:hypothetical protein